MCAVWDDPRVARGVAAQLELRRSRLAEGDRPVGWKVAVGSRQAQENLGIDGPLVGFLTSRSLVESGSTFSVAGFTKPAFEAEIAVHMGADLGAGASREETSRAIAALGPAIELVDVDRPLADLEPVLAGDIYQRGVVLGKADSSRAGGSGAGLGARVLCDGAEIAQTDDPAAFAGDSIESVRQVAHFLAAFGERLSAGDVIITGLVIPLVWPSAGQRYEYELEPLGRLEVTFTG